MIPPFDPVTGALPPGIHPATWAELVVRYGYNPIRRHLLAGLRLALQALGHAGCRRAYLAGSFVTAKPEPGDFDVCWDKEGIDARRLHDIFLVMDNDRQMQRDVFGGELFPAHWIADLAGNHYLRYFQQNEGTPVGVVAIDPRRVP